MKNELKMTISADIANDAFVRSSVAAFCLPLEPSIDGLEDIKTVVSEAFTNSVIHGYDGDKSKFVDVCVSLEDGKLEIIVKDEGCGIADVEKAMQPFSERNGLYVDGHVYGRYEGDFRCRQGHERRDDQKDFRG